MVVKVKKGVIYEIVWDNACYDCDDSCTKNIQTLSGDKNKTMTYESCYKDLNSCSNEYDCDPSFYITWFGTDKNKRQLKTSNLAMSKFKRYSIKSLYNSVKNIFKKN